MKSLQSKSLHLILLFGLLLSTLSACGPSAEDLAVTQLVALTQTQAALPTVTPAPSATLTDIPTITPTETLIPTATSTDTPTPEPKVIISASGETPAYSGPNNEAYVEVTTLTQGQELEYVGRSEDGQWIAIALTDYQDVWVSVEHLLINFDIDTLEVIAAPPTPETKFRLIVVNNLAHPHLISIPEANIPVTQIESGSSLVFYLTPDTYAFYYGRSQVNELLYITLDKDRTVTFQHKIIVYDEEHQTKIDEAVVR